MLVPQAATVPNSQLPFLLLLEHFEFLSCALYNPWLWEGKEGSALTTQRLQAALESPGSFPATSTDPPEELGAGTAVQTEGHLCREGQGNQRHPWLQRWFSEPTLL